MSLPSSENPNNVVSDSNTQISTILSICSQAYSSLGSQQIGKTNVIPFIHSIMEAVETFQEIKGMPGNKKKQLALDCLQWLINNRCSLPELEKQELLFFINQIAPPAIDVIVAVANGFSQLTKKYCPTPCCNLS